MESNIVIVNKIGRNAKPEYKKSREKMVRIQGTPGLKTNEKAKRIEQAIYDMMRH